MKKLTVVNSFETPSLCEPCGGKCCKRSPGLTMPHEFGETEEEIKKGVRRALSTGQWAIDNWDGDPREDVSLSEQWGDDKYLRLVYYVRPRMVHETSIFNNSWSGACVFHSPAVGCTIFENRPSECRGLKPSKDRCKSEHSSKKDCVIAWIPYSDMLGEIGLEIE